MTPATLAGVLALRRDALLQAFHSRWSLPVGALLVFSAGIARNYDGEDLLAQPSWLAAPFGASLVTSFLLWVWFAVCAGPIRFPDYLKFLGVYWLTAPLAWLYGIPYERFLTPVEAVNANAWTLLVVSLWRVLIIARLFQVLYGIHLVRTFVFTMAFGSVTIFVATLIAPRPVLDVMGGMRLPPEDRVLSGLTFLTGFFSLIASGIFGLAALTAMPKRPDQPRIPAPPPRPEATQVRPTALIIVGALSILAWTPLLLINQPLQRNRRAAEQAFARADDAGMLAQLSARTPDDYPPNWRLPGAHLPAYRRLPRLSALLPLLTPDTPQWIRAGYTALARDAVLWYHPYANVAEWADITVSPKTQHPSRDEGSDDLAVIRWLTVNDPQLSDTQRERLTKWLADPKPTP